MTCLARRAAMTMVVVMLFVVRGDAQDEPFRKGMDARNNRQWKAVVASMQEAIRLAPAESERKVGGVLVFGGTEYLPHFYLGEALFNDGDCTGALAAWEESDRQGVVHKVARPARTMREGVAACEAKGYLPSAKLIPELRRAEAAVRDASSSAESLAALATTHQTVWTSAHRDQFESARSELIRARQQLESAERTRRVQDVADAIAGAENSLRTFRTTHDSFSRDVDAALAFGKRLADVESAVQAASRVAESITALIADSPVKVVVSRAIAARRDEAEDQLDRARQTLASARRSAADAELAAARGLAQDAQTALNGIRSDVEIAVTAAVDGELALLRSRTGEAFAAMDARVGMVNDAVREQPPAGEAAEQIAKGLKAAQTSLSRARTRFDQAVRARDLASARTASRSIAEIETQLDGLAALLGLAERPGVPEELRSAAQSYFEGRYHDVLNVLQVDAAASIPMPLRLHAHLLRAAALFALYQYSGRAEESLRTLAQQEADACRRLDPSFQPNPAAFGPTFIAFFSGIPAAAQ